MASVRNKNMNRNYSVETESDHDDGEDDFMMFAITDIDASSESLADQISSETPDCDNGGNFNSSRRSRSDSEGAVQPLITLRERRLMKVK